MPYAVELYFNAEMEEAVRRVWRALDQAGLPSLAALGEESRPHLSLAVHSDQLRVADLLPRLQVFAVSQPMAQLSLASIATFPTEEGVLFLSPPVTADLLTMHAAYHHTFRDLRDLTNAYYHPGQWLPHCTLAIDLPRAEVGRAVQTCLAEMSQPLEGWVEQIAVLRVERDEEGHARSLEPITQLALAL